MIELRVPCTYSMFWRIFCCVSNNDSFARSRGGGCSGSPGGLNCSLTPFRIFKDYTGFFSLFRGSESPGFIVNSAEIFL